MQESQSRLCLNELEYLEMPGLNVMLAHDFYPEGHQGGVSIIQNGRRVAANGDLRLEESPGQWSAIPKAGLRTCDLETGTIRVRMAYPDPERDRRGFNPIDYPDLQMGYELSVVPDGDSFVVQIDLDAPLPAEWTERASLSLELFPGWLFGSTCSMDGRARTFPRFASGEVLLLPDGERLAIAPESDEHRMVIERLAGGKLQLLDGRQKHNNGWFVVRSLLEPGATVAAAAWRVTPHAIPGWRSQPTIQVSQVGYHPTQIKQAVIELDPADTVTTARLVRVATSGGWEVVAESLPDEWGRFLRFRYAIFDFTDVRSCGMYAVEYAGARSSIFAIDEGVLREGVWQPTVETFLPVQMCHMRVVENYRVWHGACHLDDARMAPVDHNHFDGYLQGASTLCSFKSGEPVPGLDRGGWHDAGDYDLRIESQAATVHGLSLAFEQFGLDLDRTTIDQDRRVVELRRPDGQPDVLQQVQHGLLAILGGYRSLGRFFRGIIEPTLAQYVHLGDAATQTDNVVGTEDDRWVFTEDNPKRELGVAAALASASRVVGALDSAQARECLDVALEVAARHESQPPADRAPAVLELLLATDDERFKVELVGRVDEIASRLDECGWILARATLAIEDEDFHDRVRALVAPLRARIGERAGRNPYGVPFEPSIWGAGWAVQRFGFRQYWLHRAFPEIFSTEPMYRALDFVLGCHPGSNPCSLVSGVGANSLLQAYGVNRADEACIPGGVASGTALIRPDFPELLEWPYLWQQTEYCVGHPTTDFVFLVAAADSLLNTRTR